MTKPPPWIQTITGSLAFAPLAGVQTFSVRQSSPIWQVVEKALAERMLSHGLTGCGGA